MSVYVVLSGSDRSPHTNQGFRESGAARGMDLCQWAPAAAAVKPPRTFQLNVKIFTGHNNNTITHEGGEGEGGVGE